ncbi:tyrosine recombinase XerC (plasmid) [Abditibacteriota bacterium]|nr:tyrosine recombinase XerC [Abditibacteriota bacterium]
MNPDLQPQSPENSEIVEPEVVEGQIVEGVPTTATEGATSPFSALAVRRPSDQSETTSPALVYLASLAPSGRRTMKGKLEAVCELLTNRRDLLALPWHLLRYEHVAAIRSRLEEKGLAPASINATLYALRGVAKAAWNLEQMSMDDYGRIKNVQPVRGSRLPAGRSVSPGELSSLLDACDRGDHPSKRGAKQSHQTSGVRDSALLAVLYIGGLRRSEAAALSLDDYTPETGTLKVRGKGNKERLVYFSGTASEAIADWLTLRGDHPGALFQPVRKNGSIYKDANLTDSAIYKALRKRALQAGVKSFSPHDLRRTFVGDLLDRGHDIVTVQLLAGHASVSTTARYDRRGEETKKRAAHSLHLPYRSKS